ncbi:Alpha/Beta hydrolase protein [Blyttiomyces helicus]|uniref:Alpha/Beta hydrolase protein n=1 Tax=Blyttiomyces helicus TaxID=388810 RepID=A0A4P9WIY9_9FUNG|nr:Alpha/Beta hydrolase protein [Blyttiomyces helicus]|eukprot:RKO91883.1 Alpha/Beta hydrolase protein [Blyttiomyces helicus]
MLAPIILSLVAVAAAAPSPAAINPADRQKQIEYMTGILNVQADPTWSTISDVDLANVFQQRLLSNSAAAREAGAGNVKTTVTRRETRSTDEVSQQEHDDLALHAYYMSAAYCLSGVIENWNCGSRCGGPTAGTKVWKYFDENFLTQNVVGYVATNDNMGAIIVAYRGTLSPQNALVDIDLLYKSQPDSTFSSNQSPPSNAFVHSGFQNAYYVIGTLNNLISQDQFSNYEIHVVGHSMGGAIASVATLDIISNFPNSVVKTYTYGQPRTGNQIWSDWYNTLPIVTNGNVFRVTHNIDPVPQVPLTCSDPEICYHHHNTPIFLPNFLYTDSAPVVSCDSNAGEDTNCQVTETFVTTNPLQGGFDISAHLIGYFDHNILGFICL